MAASAQRPLRVWERLARAGGIRERLWACQAWGHGGITQGLPGLGQWRWGGERGRDSPSLQASVSHLSREYG